MRRSTAKILVALALTGSGSAIVVGFKATDPIVASLPDQASSATPSGTSGPGGASTTGSSGQVDPTQASSAAAASPAATSPSVAAGYADGTYQGAAVEEPWGTFQVQAVVSGGQLLDVELVASPQDRHSSRINGIAVPILTESAVATQSAAVDMVSGATWTSQSYATSLQAALDQAKAAAVAAG
jgi:uncharacterized protein with FMN-binding domain